MQFFSSRPGTTSSTFSHNSILPDPSALAQRPPSLWSTCTRRWRPYEDEQYAYTPRADNRQWSDRHHVVDSRRNRDQAPGRRVYFDTLPHLRVRQGAYSDVPLYVVGDVHDDPGSFVHSLNWKWSQFPQFSRPATASLASSRQTSRVTLLDVDTTAPQSQVATGTSSSSSPRRTASSSNTPKKKKKQIQVKSAMSSISGPPELLHFVRWCEAKHGHLVNTWRKLDNDGNMTLSKPEFLKGLKDMGYLKATADSVKDGQKLWGIFTGDQDELLSFIKFVPDLAIDLARFKHWAEETFGGVKAAFRAFDGNGNGNLSYLEFLQACQRFGMWQRLKDIVHTLFIMLDDGAHKGGLGEITETELEFLDRWRCPPYLWAEPDFQAKKQFWKQLLSLYKDNALIAWRKAMDKDGSMKVDYSEFYKACAKLMRSGALENKRDNGERGVALVNRIYITFDPNRSGYISLRRWDHQVYELLRTFTLWARKEFGKVSDAVPAWERGPGQGVSLGAFKIGVQSLGMTEEELKMLFSGLSLEGVAVKAGKISLDELFFLDKWDPDKLLEEELAWENLVGTRFGHSHDAHHNHTAHAQREAQAKRFPAVHAVNAGKQLGELGETREDREPGGEEHSPE